METTETSENFELDYCTRQVRDRWNAYLPFLAGYASLHGPIDPKAVDAAGVPLWAPIHDALKVLHRPAVKVSSLERVVAADPDDAGFAGLLTAAEARLAASLCAFGTAVSVLDGGLVATHYAETAATARALGRVRARAALATTSHRRGRRHPPTATPANAPTRLKEDELADIYLTDTLVEGLDGAGSGEEMEGPETDGSGGRATNSDEPGSSVTLDGDTDSNTDDGTGAATSGDVRARKDMNGSASPNAAEPVKPARVRRRDRRRRNQATLDDIHGFIAATTLDGHTDDQVTDTASQTACDLSDTEQHPVHIAASDEPASTSATSTPAAEAPPVLSRRQKRRQTRATSNATTPRAEPVVLAVTSPEDGVTDVAVPRASRLKPVVKAGAGHAKRHSTNLIKVLWRWLRRRSAATQSFIAAVIAAGIAQGLVALAVRFDGPVVQLERGAALLWGSAVITAGWRIHIWWKTVNGRGPAKQSPVKPARPNDDISKPIRVDALRSVVAHGGAGFQVGDVVIIDRSGNTHLVIAADADELHCLAVTLEPQPDDTVVASATATWDKQRRSAFAQVDQVRIYPSTRIGRRVAHLGRSAVEAATAHMSI